MKKFLIPAMMGIVASIQLSGCAGPGYSSNVYPNQAYPTANYPYSTSQQPYYAAYGTVDSIQLAQSNSTSGGGSILGGLIGGLLGTQVGGGQGRTAATVVGAVSGAIIGDQMERRNNASRTQYQIGVRLDNGMYQTLTQDSVYGLNVGDRVRIENNIAYRF
ncbi:MAG: glycine zipper 2TM domain-containing protein [Burkholderiales bacterium]|nr:glycine zipper 2TM domain-containing protein [Burkholderiales bacterium]